MQENTNINRRLLVKSTVFGALAVALPNMLYAKNIEVATIDEDKPADAVHDRYPAIPLAIAEEVVGISHFNLERLKQLVEPRPELAKACWDWGYGDWESAIAAASHVGRVDIIEYLISKGAAPTIFTLAVLGRADAVKEMIQAYPCIQRCDGPHGISLLQHAQTGLQSEGVDKTRAQQLVDFLKGLGDANGRQYLSLEEKDQSRYLGDYKYGEGKEDGFSIRLNMRKMISLGKLGKTGGTLWRIGENEFTYQGAPSVVVKFEIVNNLATSFVIKEPGLVLKATRI